MRNVDPFMKRHLKALVFLDGEKIHEQPICDPFINNKTEIEFRFSLLDRLKVLLLGVWKCDVQVRVRGDAVAHKRWFAGQDGCDRCGTTIGYPHDGSNADNPGYHHGDERLCQACYYGIPDDGVEEMTLRLKANEGGENQAQ